MIVQGFFNKMKMVTAKVQTFLHDPNWTAFQGEKFYGRVQWQIINFVRKGVSTDVKRVVKDSVSSDVWDRIYRNLKYPKDRT